MVRKIIKINERSAMVVAFAPKPVTRELSKW